MVRWGRGKKCSQLQHLHCPHRQRRQRRREERAAKKKAAKAKGKRSAEEAATKADRDNDDEDADELDRDAQLLRKLKRGKITQAEFDAAVLGLEAEASDEGSER